MALPEWIHMTRKITTTSPTFTVPPLPAPPPEYLTRNEAGELLRVGERQVTLYIRAGLKAARIGKKWLINRADLDDFVKNHLHVSEVAA